jgi:hypothetical protein
MGRLNLNAQIESGGRAFAVMSALATGLYLPVADPLRPGTQLDRLVESCLA